MIQKQNRACADRREAYGRSRSAEDSGPRDFTDREWNVLCVLFLVFGLLVVWEPV